jgi:hypothetical protein
MKIYLVSYASESTTAATVAYGVENLEDIYKLIIKDFFNYETGDTDVNGVDILKSEEVLDAFDRTGDIHGVCADAGVYFGDIISLEDSLSVIITEKDYE